MKQTFIDDLDICVLKDGTILKDGDEIEYTISQYKDRTVVVLNNGKLCMRDNFMCGKLYPIDHFLKECYHSIKKL